MGKSLLLFLALLLSSSLSAQNRASFIDESFDSEEIPAGWTIAGEAQENWSIWPTHQAGGEVGEIKLYWRPAFNGITRLVSPAIDLSGVNEIIFAFKGFLDNYMDVPHQIGIATTSDDGATWNVAWEDSFSTSNQGQHSFLHTVSTPDMGKDNVKFCIFYNGDSSNMNAWYFDDIEIYSLDELNLSLLSIDFPTIVGVEANEVGFEVKNTGSNTVESFEVQYQIEGKDAVVETFSANIESTETEFFTFDNTLSLAPGTYNMTVTILSVNGSSDNTSDNSKSQAIDVAIGDVQRIPMIEHFSSSYCAPCVYVNQSMNILTENNPGKYTYTKYIINLYSGPDYFTDESLFRNDYYEVVGAPTLFFDGEYQGSTPISTNDFNQEYNRPAYVDIKGAFDIQGSTINVTADIMTLVNIPELRLFVSVNETTTTGNTGSNGETEFHHVMMKMLEDAEGNPTSLNVGEYKSFEFSYDLSDTYVEELDDLEVAVWAQNYETQEIYNSHYMYEYTTHPYPAQNLQLTETETSLDITWEAPETGTPTGYNLYVNNNLIAENTTELSYSIEDAAGIYAVVVVALYENDMKSVGIADMTIIGEELYPCNAPDNLDAAIEQDAEGFDSPFKVTMSWEATDHANEYAIYLDGELLDNTTETSYIKGFDEEGEHYFSVAAICHEGESEQSEAFDFELIGVSIDEYGNSFEIYPNPAENILNIKTNDIIKEINIYNIIGVKVCSENDIYGNNINIENLNRGTYFINIKTENNEIIKQFIKQ